MRFLVLVLLVLTLSCSAPSPQQAAAPATLRPTSHEPPKDLSSLFPLAGQTGMKLVPDHLLGKDFMPGGNLANYKTAAGEYQIFLIEVADAHLAAYVLLDWKNAIPDAKYLAHMGGYFAMDKGKPIYLFAKGPYVVGLVGLPQEKADPEARRFAARI